MNIPLKRRNRIPHTVPLSVLVVALSACVVEPELLNSERIEAKFGTYGIDVLSYVDGIRRASLFSTHNGRKIARTYAVVRFDNVPMHVIGNEHAQIQAGGSIGATFKAKGWQVFKETMYIGHLMLPDQEERLHRLMALEGSQNLAMHVYRLLLRKDMQIIEYSTIIELHHPEYLNRNALDELYLVDEPRTLSADEVDVYRQLVLAKP